MANDYPPRMSGDVVSSDCVAALEEKNQRRNVISAILRGIVGRLLKFGDAEIEKKTTDHNHHGASRQSLYLAATTN